MIFVDRESYRLDNKPSPPASQGCSYGSVGVCQPSMKSKQQVLKIAKVIFVRHAHAAH